MFIQKHIVYYEFWYEFVHHSPLGHGYDYKKIANFYYASSKTKEGNNEENEESSLLHGQCL